MMKKLLFIIIGLSLIFSLISCSDNIPSSIVGTWEYSNHTELKEYLEDQLDDSFFYKIYYQFNEDGSGSTWTENYPENKFTFTYTFDGKILSITLGDGQIQELECEFHETYFYVSDGKEDMKFEKIN